MRSSRYTVPGQELQATRSLLETTFQSIREAVVVVDARERTILACNPAVTDVTGYEPDELLGRSTEVLHVDGKGYREFGDRSERALKREGVFRGEFRLRRKDGCVIPTGHLVSYLDDPDGRDGEPTAAVNVIRDLTETRLRDREVSASRRRLQRLSRDLLQVREEERARISRHLHDVVGQTLTAAKFGLDSLASDAESKEMSERLELARQLVARSLQEIRDLSVELRPAVLDDLGLVPAIRWHLERLREGTDPEIALTAAEADTSGGHLPREVQTQAFRIVQEAVLNAIRHADATRIEVDVRTTGGELVIEVRDDGRGFEPDRPGDAPPEERQLGLVGMEERASLVSGSLQLTSRRGEGTVVRLRVPVGSGAERSGRSGGDDGPPADRP